MQDLPTEPGSAGEGAAGKPPRLTRLGHALRQRDWLGIGIEFIVVTLGVLLAFQVDQWGDQRKQAQEERLFLERLYLEYHRGIAELNDGDSDSRTIREQIRQAMAARGSPTQLAAWSHRGVFACSLGRFRRANFNDTGFEELIASGRLNLISDAALRSEVRDLAAAQATSSRQVETARDVTREDLPYLNNYYQLDLEPGGREHCVIDWAELVKDQTAINAVVRAYRLHGSVMEGRQKVRTRTEALIARLACKLGKPECQR